jgi:hypothetical protein
MSLVVRRHYRGDGLFLIFGDEVSPGSIPQHLVDQLLDRGFLIEVPGRLSVAGLLRDFSQVKSGEQPRVAELFPALAIAPEKRDTVKSA